MTALTPVAVMAKQARPGHHLRPVRNKPGCWQLCGRDIKPGMELRLQWVTRTEFVRTDSAGFNLVTDTHWVTVDVGAFSADEVAAMPDIKDVCVLPDGGALCLRLRIRGCERTARIPAHQKMHLALPGPGAINARK